MNLPESAMLAGLIRTPIASPFQQPQKSHPRAKCRAHPHAQTWLHYGRANGRRHGVRANIGPKPKASPQDNWAMDSILRELELVIDRDQYDNGGLRIYTTIDGPLQNVAEASLRKRLHQIESIPGFPHKPMKAHRLEDSDNGAPIWKAPRLPSTAGPAAFEASQEVGTTRAASSIGPCWGAARSAPP